MFYFTIVCLLFQIKLLSKNMWEETELLNNLHPFQNKSMNTNVYLKNS